MKKIVIYWKWGIGKSTISTHLSAAYALKWKKVLQVWCDPKHDSCKRLLWNKQIHTVIELSKNINNLKTSKIITPWKFGIDCIEVWWPVAWIGCAGRWVSIMFEIFESTKILEKNKYDITIFDVLWDVVCWGFAAPLKNGFADTVYIVLSEEIMSIYAANNIAKAVANYSRNWIKLGWLILNLRDNNSQTEHIKQFAKKLWTKIIGTVPRLKSILEAEKQNKTLFEIDMDWEENIFEKLSEDILANTDLVIPTPMEDKEFDDFIYKNFNDKNG